MIDKKHDDGKFIRPLAFIGIAAIIIISFSFFILWRIDNPRAELIRIAVIDKIVPNLDWAITPATKVSQMAQNFQNYKRLYDQNQELRNELQKMSDSPHPQASVTFGLRNLKPDSRSDVS